MGPYRLMTKFRPVVACSALLALALPAAADAATRLVVRGGGFGHGVGMSQYGALGQAQQGRTYRQILGHYYTGTAVAKLDGDPVVRVLIQSGKRSVTFSGAAQAGDRRLQPGRTYSAIARGGAQVVLRSSSGRKLKTFPAPLRIVGPRQDPVLLRGSGAYRGAFELRPAQFGGLNAINAVGLENYVRGVVSAESPASWPAEALKAQAVAARTYAITTNKPGAGFDHYPDTRSQVYRGVAAERPTTDAAVAGTASEVVTYQGKPVVTYFFSTSGGRTENSEFGFPGGEAKPWLKSVDDPYDKVSPRHRWGPFRYTLTQAGKKLRGLVKGRLRGIEVVQRGVSPRIVSAQIVGSKGRTTVTGPALRARFGLYDTWAYFTTIGAKVKPAEPQDETDPSTGATPARAAGGATRRRAVLTGTIRGVERGTTVFVRRRTATGRYTTEMRTTVGRRGRYRVALARTGTYRVRVNGMYGASVKLR
jgi:stage II sporulation protein D